MTQTPKTFMAFRADAAMARAMQRLQARDGIPISEQVRRALDAWLRKQQIGYAPKKEKTR